MKNASLLSAVLILLLSVSCENSDLTPEQPLSQAQLLEEVKNWYESPLPAGIDPKKKAHGWNFNELWDQSKTHSFGKGHYIITTPILKPKSGTSIYQLITFRTNERFRGFVAQFVPDKPTGSKKSGGFSGQIKLRARNGNLLKTLKFVNGKKIINNTSTFRTMEDEIPWDGIMLPEVEITGSSYQDDNLWLWFDLMDMQNWVEDNNLIEDDSWVYEDYGGNGTQDVGVPIQPGTLVDNITDNLTDPCLQQALDRLNTDNFMKNDITQMLIQTFGTTDKINVHFDEDPTMPVTRSGEATTYYRDPTTGEYNLGISLNPNVLQSSSQEYIQDTFYHEIIHAYLNANPTIMTELQQHEAMATTYVDVMINALTNQFPSLSYTNASAIVIGGFGDLQQGNSTMFNTLLSTYSLTENQVAAISESYRNGYTGTPCLL